MDKNKLIPTERCIFCAKSLEETGGRRLLGRKISGYSISEYPKGGGNKDYPNRYIKIEDKKYFIYWDMGNRWNKENINKAIEDIKDGLTPWYCQSCGSRLCSECGAPVINPACTDILNENGTISHCAPLAPHRCINDNCRLGAKFVR